MNGTTGNRSQARPRSAAELFESIADSGVLDGHDGQCVEWCPLCRAADLVRSGATPELRDQLQTLQREALLTLRTLIDHYLERIETEPADHGPRVENIPLD